MFYVNMNDKVLGGKLSIVCEDYEQALTVRDNAWARKDMKYITISSKPARVKLKSDSVLWLIRVMETVTIHSIDSYPEWFKPGHFGYNYGK